MYIYSIEKSVKVRAAHTHTGAKWKAKEREGEREVTRQLRWPPVGLKCYSPRAVLYQTIRATQPRRE